jgi:hypothetical protein
LKEICVKQCFVIQGLGLEHDREEDTINIFRVLSLGDLDNNDVSGNTRSFLCMFILL